MEVDSKSEAIENSEALLLGDDGDEQNTEFTSGDVELLLGDDDVDAFANESYEAPSDEASTTEEKTETITEKSEAGQPIEGHYNRGRGGRPYMRGGRGYGPPFFPPRGLRPPFPGALPRFGRHPPPFAFRGRPPMGYMRYPRGMFMRPPRHHYAEEEEEEDESMASVEAGSEEPDEGGDGGPKSLMSIRVSKDIKQAVKTQILSKGPLLHAPLGMGMGPRFHLRGPPPRGPPPPGAAAPPTVPHSSQQILPGPVPAGGPHHHSSSSIGRGGGISSRGPRGGMDHHHTRGSLKRPLPSHHTSEGPRAKMMMQSSSYQSPGGGLSSGGSRSNLRTIQTVDEQRQRFQHPPPASSGVSPMQTSHYQSSFTVSHKPAPSLTQIRTVPESAPPPQKNNGNLRSIPTIGGSSVPTPMQGPRIAKTGGASHRVMISNLPPMMSFERISAMTTACGNVRTINVNENGTAIVEFANPSGAENFIRANNRKIIDRSMITVARLA